MRKIFESSKKSKDTKVTYVTFWLMTTFFRRYEILSSKRNDPGWVSWRKRSDACVPRVRGKVTFLLDHEPGAGDGQAQTQELGGGERFTEDERTDDRHEDDHEGERRGGVARHPELLVGYEPGVGDHADPVGDAGECEQAQGVARRDGAQLLAIEDRTEKCGAAHDQEPGPGVVRARESGDHRPGAKAHGGHEAQDQAVVHECVHFGVLRASSW